MASRISGVGRVTVSLRKSIIVPGAFFFPRVSAFYSAAGIMEFPPFALFPIRPHKPEQSQTTGDQQ
jgi:hypothetical protein